MGDKKSRKDKAKVSRQKEAKQAKAAKQKQDKGFARPQPPLTLKGHVLVPRIVFG